MYHYRAIYRSNYDGDTLRLDIDLGFGVWVRNQVVRLHGIDSPELRRPTLEEGRAAKEVLQYLCQEYGYLELKTVKDKKGKYGRWLGHLQAGTANNRIDVNQLMVNTGHAVRREY